MTRTQIYLPDSLYNEVRDFAKFQEVSIAELVRRGLEMLLRTTAPAAARRAAPPQWEMPKIRHMGLKADPFDDEDWRMEANMRDMCVAEDAPTDYNAEEKEGGR